MRTRILVSTLFIFALAGFVWSQPAERPKVFLGLGGEPADNGFMIRDVTANSPAAQAGLKAGDVIVKVGESKVTGFETVSQALTGKKPGDKLGLTVLRDGKEQAVEVTLAAPQPGAAQPRPGGAQPEPRGAFLGVLLQDLTPELKSRLGVTGDRGALIADVVPNSPAAKADLKDGDVITEVDGQPVAGAQSLRELIQRSNVGKKLAFKLSRGGKTLDVAAELAEATPDRIAPRAARPPQQPSPPRIVDDATKVRELERRIQELEKRIAELEKKGGKEE